MMKEELLSPLGDIRSLLMAAQNLCRNNPQIVDIKKCFHNKFLKKRESWEDFPREFNSQTATWQTQTSPWTRLEPSIHLRASLQRHMQLALLWQKSWARAKGKQASWNRNAAFNANAPLSRSRDIFFCFYRKIFILQLFAYFLYAASLLHSALFAVIYFFPRNTNVVKTNEEPFHVLQSTDYHSPSRHKV